MTIDQAIKQCEDEASEFEFYLKKHVTTRRQTAASNARQSTDSSLSGSGSLRLLRRKNMANGRTRSTMRLLNTSQRLVAVVDI